MKKKNVVGENIRRFRTEQGITQEEVALRSGLSQSYINQLELGKRNYTQKSLEVIASALSMPLRTFFEEDEKPKVSVVAEKTVPFKDKRSYRKEFLSLLKELPDSVIAHYLTLLNIERDLYKAGKKSR